MTGITKKTVSIITAVAFAIGTSGFYTAPENAFATEEQGIEGNYVEGEVIVGYVDPENVDMTEKQEAKVEETLGEAEELAVCEKTDETVALVESETKSTEELMEEISRLPNVDFVEPNYILSADSTDENPSELSASGTEKKTAEQWAFNGSSKYGINLPVWDKPGEKTSEGTVVAVLDSGVDYTHEDLDDVMWRKSGEKDTSGLKEFGEYGINVYDSSKQKDPMDDFCHGTHCAGIIAAEWNDFGVSGAANGTEIMAVKASDSNGDFTMGNIVKGYDYIIKAKEAGVNIVAVNNSWGGYVSSATALCNVVKTAGKKGIISVFASANYGKNCDVSAGSSSSGATKYFVPYFLKNISCKIVVNSITSEGSLAKTSNYGKVTTDICAPGSGILSTVPGGKYEEKNGTSMACPCVTATAAIIMARNTKASAEQVAANIRESAAPVEELSGVCNTGGILDAGKAINRVIVCPTSIIRLKGAKKSFTVKVAQQPVEQVNGYQVRYSLYSSMKNSTTKTVGTKYNAVTKKITGLKKGRKYYVQVRTYKTIDGKKCTSAWSGRKTVKTK